MRDLALRVQHVLQAVLCSCVSVGIIITVVATGSNLFMTFFGGMVLGGCLAGIWYLVWSVVELCRYPRDLKEQEAWDRMIDSWKS